MKHVQRTKTLIRKKGIDAEVREHEEWGKESEKVAEIFDVPLKHVIKSLLVFLDDTPCLTVLQGNTRLDTKKVEEITGKKVKMARAKDIKELGFEFGGIPCLGSDLPMIVDKNVMEAEFVVGSAGSPYVGIKIRPMDLVTLNDAEVAHICKAV